MAPNPHFPPISRVKIAPWQASGTSGNFGEMSRRTRSVTVNPQIVRETIITQYFQENEVLLAVISPIFPISRTFPGQIVNRTIISLTIRVSD